MNLIAIEIGLVVAALAFAACSAVDPNPPNPHTQPDPDPIVLEQDGGDGGEEAGQ